MSKTKYLGYKTESLEDRFFVHVLTDGGNIPLLMPPYTPHEKIIKRIKQFLPQLNYSDLEPKMELEIGKRYKTKSGLITEPLVKSDDDSYPFQCPATLLTWTGMGQYNVTPNPNDIIEEYVEPETPLPPREKVLAEGGTANNKQVGGDHYKSQEIEPWDFVISNKLGFLEGNAIKYIARHTKKNGAEDIKKAIHYLEKLLETLERK